MKPVDMLVEHDPPQSYGDCFRACVASVLELPATEVPHFNDSADLSSEELMDRLFAFLRPLGLYPLALEIDANNLRWLDCVRGYYVLSGQSGGGDDPHCIVATGRASLVHDPGPHRAGIKPFEDEDGAYYWLWLFVRLSQ